MKKRCVVGFFAFLLFAGLLDAGYLLSYRQASESQEEDFTRREIPSGTVTAKGESVSSEKESGYYIMELQGYVAVFLPDRSTIYEMTEISVSDLPDEVRAEVKAGKKIENEKELYSFLENYSS